VFIHNLDPFALESLVHPAPRSRSASYVGVEFHSEDNEVIGKVYDAKSQLEYVTELRGAQLAGKRPGQGLPPPSRTGR